ncbi:MAG: uracil-DNA glycosylase [Myxococcota bacterium]
MKLPPAWQDALGAELEQPYFKALEAFVAAERATKTVFPPEADVFSALALTPLADVRVLILGQDPYHDDGQAHGLCFSVKPPTRPPPSLRNIFKELASDIGVAAPGHGDLSAWARRGVLLLNAVLTVQAHAPGSHAGKGWETFTDAVIRRVDALPTPVVFCLWGAYARKKARLVDTSRHAVIEGAHPSPLSAAKFVGSRPFSAIDQALRARGRPAMDWSLPAVAP